MKTLNLLFLIAIISLIAISCSKEEMLIEQETQINEEETFTFHDVSKNELKAFNSEQEFIAYISNNPEYSSLLKKMEALKVEQKYIEKNNLYDLDENSEKYANYMSRFEGNLKAAGGALYKNYNAKGSRLGWTHAPNPRMRRSRWDRASSWQGAPYQMASVILCGRTWFRGSKAIIHVYPDNPGWADKNKGIINLSYLNFNDNTRSYY